MLFLNERTKDLCQKFYEHDFDGMKLVDVHSLRRIFELFFDNHLNENDIEIIKSADKIRNAPYQYARNSLDFQIGMEKEAEDITKMQNLIMNQAETLINDAIDKMPDNLKATYNEYQKYVLTRTKEFQKYLFTKKD